MAMKPIEHAKQGKESSPPLLVGTAMQRARDLAGQGIKGNRLQRLIRVGQVERAGFRRIVVEHRHRACRAGLRR